MADLELSEVLVRDDVEYVRAALDAGTLQVEKKDRNGRTLLHRAASAGALKVVRLLLRRGADVHSKNRWGMGPLSDAARVGARDVIVPLVRAGASVTESDEQGMTPMHHAVLSGREDDVEILRMLIELGGDMDQKNSYGATVEDWLMDDPRYRGLLKS